MADKEINLFGSKVKRGYVIAGGVVVVAAVFYGWRKNKQGAASNTSAPSTSSAPTAGSGGGSYPPDGTTGNPSDPYSTDPSSGMTYGDEGQFSTAYGSGFGSGYGGYDPYSGYGSGGGFYPGSTGGIPAYTTNGQWSQAAEDYLVQTVGGNANTIAAALGKYVNGQALTSDQMSVIEQAIAFVGYPPQNGPEGYPPHMKSQATPPPPGNTATVPRVTGYPAGEAFNVVTAAGLRPHENSASIKPDWIVTSQSPAAGTHVNPGSQVSYGAKAPGGGGGHPGQVQVPHVTGMKAGDAFNAIKRAGLAIDDPHAGQRGEPQKKVRSQSPRAGTWVARGSRVTIST